MTLALYGGKVAGKLLFAQLMTLVLFSVLFALQSRRISRGGGVLVAECRVHAVCMPSSGPGRGLGSHRLVVRRRRGAQNGGDHRLAGRRPWDVQGRVCPIGTDLFIGADCADIGTGRN